MEITDKVSNSAHAAYDKIADAANQTTEVLGKKASNSKMPSSN